MLECGCGIEGDVDAAWYYVPGDWFSILSTKRSRKCSSCKTLISIGSECLEFARTRAPKSDIEERIYGDGWDSIPLASYYQCSSCGEIYLNLQAIGYCMPPDTDMRQALKEYHELTGFKKECNEPD